MRKMLIVVVAITALLGAVSAGASTIVFGSLFPSGPGNTAYAASGVTFTTPSGYFETKSLFGYTAVGVSGTNVANQTGGEIDPGESILATFAAPSSIDYFYLAFLFEGPEYTDYEEIATITANGGTTGTLQAVFSVSGTNASWTVTGGFGTVTNISPATDTGAGVWRVDNPFGSAPVNTLSFSALDGTCAPGLSCSDQSDYSLERIAFTPVPEPGSMLLLGSGLAALWMRRRRS